MAKLTYMQKVNRRSAFKSASMAIQYTDYSRVPKVPGNTVFAYREERAGYHAKCAAHYIFMAHPELREVANV